MAQAFAQKYQSLQKKKIPQCTERSSSCTFLKCYCLKAEIVCSFVLFFVKQVVSGSSAEEEGLAIINQLARFCLCWLLTIVYIWGEPCYQHTASPS